MKCHLLVGEGSWPVDMLLRRVLGEEVEAPLRVLDLQGRGATQLDDTMRRALTTRGTRWYDLGERRAPRCPWRYRPTDADDRVLHHLVSGWVTILGGAPVAAEVDAFVARTRAFARVVQGASATLPSWSLVDLVNTLRAPPPVLAARVEHVGPLFAPSLEATLEALVRALRYPAVFAAMTAPELSLGDPPQRVDWYELPRGHLEPMEWQLLARLVTAVTMQRAEGAEVVVLDPARGAGTRIDPRCFVGAASVSAAWTPAGEAAEVVLHPWVELHASVWVARNRLPLSAWTNKLPGEAARTLATLQADEMIATRLSPEGHWLRRRLRRAEAVIPVPRGINRRREDAPAHLADAAQSALRLASPSHGLLSRVASLPLLRRAWHRLRTLRPDYVGTDAVTARQFGDGLDSHLQTLRSELLEGTYRPLPMRRFHIPKDDGGKRTLGIVAVRDRIVQTACLDVLDPLLDATFSDHSYAYRVRRGAPPAVLAAWDAIRAGTRWLVRCDVAQCFDSLDHAVLFTRLREVIADDALLHLLGLWARADILVGDDLVPTDVGVAQGTVLAPLLCNLYLTPLDRALEAAGVPFVRYADDLLLCGPDEASAREALSLTERVLAGPLRLQLNPRKTQVVSAEQGVDHLGFRLSAKGLDMQPAKKDKLLDEMRRRLGKIVEASTRGEESLREAFMALRAVLNGFAAYYESVGEAPRVQASLVQLGRAVHGLAQDVLPPGLQQHPVWARRGPLWRAEVPEPVVTRPDPVGAYPEEQHRAVTPPPSPETRVEEVAREKEGAEVPRAAGVLLEDGHLHVMRHGVYLSLRADALVVRALRRSRAVCPAAAARGHCHWARRDALRVARTVARAGRGAAAARQSYGHAVHPHHLSLCGRSAGARGAGSCPGSPRGGPRRPRDVARQDRRAGFAAEVLRQVSSTLRRRFASAA